MSVSSHVRCLRWIVPGAVDGPAGIDHDLIILNLDGEQVQWSWGGAADDLTDGIKNRTMAGTVEAPFIFPPGYRASQMRAALPERQHAAVIKAADVKTPTLHMADGAGLEFTHFSSNNRRAERPWLDAGFEILDQYQARLTEQAKQGDSPGRLEKSSPVDSRLRILVIHSFIAPSRQVHPVHPSDSVQDTG
jgi:hypothetical protein